MASQVTTFLMFQGKAEEALTFYVSLFPGSALERIERYGPGEMGAEGTVKLASFTLAGREYRAIDSPVKHAFGFTPAISLFVDCESREELDAAFARLSEGGGVLMPLGEYGFSAAFAWVNDRFGVSWQLNLPFA
ncbi:VOC family protein [Planctomyces sp. SH-PL62]|uniref:VOC family protein n=1 Tax=Planctomyces sp. SH-PL62 TaxID=1636152 RepID=UPI00078E1717|nr:VOC family protein [Planctomyces sp. SH-PL62]AMV37937.1 3-demethylubiquinone-9 3-methyltransferase [Planctomyces sp. SH-PL62]